MQSFFVFGGLEQFAKTNEDEHEHADDALFWGAYGADAMDALDDEELEEDEEDQEFRERLENHELVQDATAFERSCATILAKLRSAGVERRHAPIIARNAAKAFAGARVGERHAAPSAAPVRVEDATKPRRFGADDQREDAGARLRGAADDQREDREATALVRYAERIPEHLTEALVAEVSGQRHRDCDPECVAYDIQFLTKTQRALTRALGLLERLLARYPSCRQEVLYAIDKGRMIEVVVGRRIIEAFAIWQTKTG